MRRIIFSFLFVSLGTDYFKWWIGADDLVSRMVSSQKYAHDGGGVYELREHRMLRPWTWKK